MLLPDILPEECCICLDTLHFNNSFLYFDCNHRIHESCSNLLTNCPMCRSPRIDIAVNINENNDTLITNQQLEAGVNSSQITISNQDSRICRLNNYKLIRFLILIAAALFFIGKYLI
jgi:hypothetical protein